MGNRVNLIYLIVCSCILSLLSLHLSGQPFWELLVILTTSLSYPFILAWRRPKTGFWMGGLWLLLILTVALFCDFMAGLLGYVDYQYLRLGREFRLLEVMNWYLGENPAFFFVLVVIPATIIAAVFYPIGCFSSLQLFRLIKSHSEPEDAAKTKGAPELGEKTF